MEGLTQKTFHVASVDNSYSKYILLLKYSKGILFFCKEKTLLEAFFKKRKEGLLSMQTENRCRFSIVSRLFIILF